MKLVSSNKKKKCDRDNEIFGNLVKEITNMVVNSGLDIIDQKGILYWCIEKMTEEYAKNGIDFYSHAKLINHANFMGENIFKKN